MKSSIAASFNEEYLIISSIISKNISRDRTGSLKHDIIFNVSNHRLNI
jgi:hypothetical protein